MKWTIAPEQEHEFPEIYELVRVAFLTAADADGDEHDYVNDLRKTKGYIPGLALTCKDGTKIIGHLMLTRLYITRQQQQVEALLLSPLCVQLEYRGKGVGGLLIRYALEKAKEMGFKAVFLAGEPAYYSRFGFTSVTRFHLKHKGNIPVKYVLGLELEEGFLGTKGGIVTVY